ncbi:hypothetical protein RchiOBHm_Chr5g0025411 [Rosa chinensis]|uniref:Uncharacterized protein n=1 Tax=Rosa chinensis TaxID=74649 RepID=A0A2P6Q8L6_ROSCH|nr:hypothetical protein RchiOBHm_Chr5g0025411 [Rosa chinensis]
MKLGVNHSNGLIWSLTSWTTNYYPPLGIFTLDWDPNGRQLEIRGHNCGGYNTDGGCQRSSWPPDCLADFDDQYELKKGYFKPITSIFTS